MEKIKPGVIEKKKGWDGTMMVHEVSQLTGVSIRTLQYYDSIDLLKPAAVTEAGYRLYDDKSLERLQQILLFRELEFSLKDIKKILESPDFNRNKALEQQIELLKLKKEHLENLIQLAQKVRESKEGCMDFKAFDTSKIDEYSRQAKNAWGKTSAYQEFEEKSRERTREEEQNYGTQMMQIMKEFGLIRAKAVAPDSEESQKLVKKLQNFISKNYYHCTKEILAGLGMMYAEGGEFTGNIDAAAGDGTAVFIKEAIQVYCEK